MLQVLAADNIVARCAVVRIFGSGILHSESSRQQTLQEITITPSVAQQLEEVLLVCLETVLTLSSSDYIVSQQSPVVTRYLSEVMNNSAAVVVVAPISAGETVVNAVALVSSLLESRRAAPSMTSLYDPSFIQLIDISLNSTQELSLQSSCCRAVLAVLTGMWERLAEMTNSSTSDLAIVQAMWDVLLSLSSGRQSAEVLLVNGVVDVMKNWIHSLCDSTNTITARDLLLLSAFQVLRSLLIGFEEYAAHLILLTDTVLSDVTEYLYHEMTSTAHLELIIHLLHCLSTSTANSTQLISKPPSPPLQLSPFPIATDGVTDSVEPSLIDWLCDQIITSLSAEKKDQDQDQEKEVEEVEAARVRKHQLQPITISRMICLLCNLSRVKGASERILSNLSLLESLKRSLASEMRSASPKRTSSLDSEVSNGPLWSIQELSNSLTSPVPQATSLLSVTLSLFNSLAPAMYLMDSERALRLLPMDLLPSLLLVASESTDILHIDQVSLASVLSVSLTLFFLPGPLCRGGLAHPSTSVPSFESTLFDQIDPPCAESLPPLRHIH
jgi:hypothetical protein